MFVLYLSAVIEAHKFLQKENSESEKTRKKTQKELEIKKAKATAAAQNEADEVVTELKIMHPVCSAKTPPVYIHCLHLSDTHAFHQSIFQIWLALVWLMQASDKVEARQLPLILQTIFTSLGQLCTISCVASRERTGINVTLSLMKQSFENKKFLGQMILPGAQQMSCMTM
jgi:hypothetical protein